MNRIVAALVGVVVCGSASIATGAAFTGPTSPYYLDNYATSTVYIVQGTSVASSFPLSAYGANVNNSQLSLAVGSSVMTHGYYTGYGGAQAGEYTLAGTPTGTSYDSFPLTAGSSYEYSYDGTTDGVHNYYVQYSSQASTGSVFENVVETDLDWQNPTVLFSVQSSPNQCCEFLGISYDLLNNSLWVSGWVSNEIRDYSMGGALLSTFSTAHSSNDALAYDPADNTLWISYAETSVLEQYSTSGALLQSGTPAGLPSGSYLAGEFALGAAVPEPATLGLLGLGLTAAGFARRRALTCLCAHPGLTPAV